jgi:hypothetical protein
MGSGLKRGGVMVKVLIHLTADGQYATGIITSEWQGATRLDRRLARLRPVIRPGSVPSGVDPIVWQAYSALHGLVAEQAGTGALPPE